MAVIGRGLTGVFAASQLARAGVDVVLVGARRPAAVEPMAAGSERISVVPVLPPFRAAPSPPYLGAPTPLRLTYHGDPELLKRPSACTAGSLAARQWGNSAALVLSQKQFGQAIWDSPLAEVQSKIARAYGDNRPVPRSGYLPDGSSPYWPTYQEAAVGLTALESDIQRWDRRRRQLVLRSGDLVDYQRAVVTVPFGFLARLLELKVATPVTGPAVFTVVSTSGHVAQRLVYDLDPRSPVFRVLTPTNQTAVVQLSLFAQGNEGDSRARLVEAVESLLDARVQRITIEEHRQELAYPLEPLSSDAADRVSSMRRNDDVMFFGRYSTHRYVDLHELPWDELSAWLH